MRTAIAFLVALLTAAVCFAPIWLISNDGEPGIQIIGTVLSLWVFSVTFITFRG